MHLVAMSEASCGYEEAAAAATGGAPLTNITSLLRRAALDPRLSHGSDTAVARRTAARGMERSTLASRDTRRTRRTRRTRPRMSHNCNRRSRRRRGPVKRVRDARPPASVRAAHGHGDVTVLSVSRPAGP